jgi:iron(III) transport system permease protein
MTAYCVLVALFVFAVFGMALFASFVKFWPYDLSFSSRHYVLGLVDMEVGAAFVNSLILAVFTASAGTAVVFIGAVPGRENPRRRLAAAGGAVPRADPDGRAGARARPRLHLLLQCAAEPLHFLYATMTLLVLCTIIHFYTTGHLTAMTALKALDAEFESVSASLKVPFWKTFWRVTLPICTPALVDISRYFFINAMTTISAVVFLYSPDTKVASIAILNLDEAGEAGAAAAMAILIAAASLTACIGYVGLGWLVERNTQAWRSTR